MKIKKDQIVGSIIFAIGLIALFMSMQIKVKTGSTDPGSRIFPLMASVLLLICGLGVVFTAKGGDEKMYLSISGWKKLAFSFVVMIAYIFALKYIGFLVSTPIFLLIITTMLSSGEQLAVWKKIIYAAIITGLFYYLLHGLLKMNLPGGILF